MPTIEFTTNQTMIEWAATQAKTFLTPLNNRWLHTQGVVKQAQKVGEMLDEKNRSYLIAAAYLHDIGYAPALKKTGFHPLDGADYLQSHGLERLASLVAHHFAARFEAKLHGLSNQLDKYPQEHSIVADALTYCDITTSPTGKTITFQERIDEILSRYSENHIVLQATHQALPSLALATKRTEKLLNGHDTT